MSKTIKKALLMMTCFVLGAVIAVGGTMAYLTDNDYETNVMTLGNVDIEQHELQRKDGIDYKNGSEIANGDELEIFDQYQLLFPSTYTELSNYTAKHPDEEQFWWGNYVTADVTGNGSSNGLWDDKLTGAMDKFIFVENTGKSDAYYRTIIAFECPEGMEYSEGYDKEFMMNVNLNSRFVWSSLDDGDDLDDYVIIDGTRYLIAVATYQLILKPGTVSRPSLLQVVMTHHATNEDMKLLGDTYEILALSQAVQTSGFENSKQALDTAFGKVTAENVKYWFGDEEPTVVDTLEELQNALDNATGETTIIVNADITGNVTVTQKPDVKITIDGNGNTFSGVILVDGKSKTYTTAGLTIKNMNFKADSISADACIRLGDGTNDTRYTCNVTVSGCTFDVPGAVGVKSYTGGDKNLTIAGCTATANAQSLVQAKGIDGILVENCNVYSKNGLNFNNSDNVTVSNCNVDVRGYAVRFGESSGGVGAAETYFIKNSTLKSLCEDGDAVIVLRGTADNSTLTIENTTITGTREITNNATNVTVIK